MTDETNDETESTFNEWVILELMGHRKLAGLVRDVTLFGSRMCRIDLPTTPPSTQFYSAQAIYAVTPTTEELCRRYMRAAPIPRPVSRWELPSETEGDGDDDGICF